MDDYYMQQAEMPYFSGASRQRGRGLGALALTVGRFALPFLKKYALPAAKRIGKDLFSFGVSEAMEVATGKKKLKDAVKSTATRTVKKQIGGAKRKRVISSKTPKKRSRTEFFSQIKP